MLVAGWRFQPPAAIVDDVKVGAGPDPSSVWSLAELARELDLLRCRAARGTGKARVSLSELAARVKVPRSTVHSYVAGDTLAPIDVLDRMVVALGATQAEQASWGDAWFRVASQLHDQRQQQASGEPGQGPPRQLPAVPTQFTGRVAELAWLDDVLVERATGETVVIGGQGGIGKTALALHWAHRNAWRFPDGQLHVDLRGFDSNGEPLAPAAALRGLLAALGVPAASIPAGVDELAARYRSMLADRRVLVLLDNAASSEQVQPLLPGSPSCAVLATSRRRLSGLLAVHGARQLVLDVLPDADAGRLLAGHLGAARSAAEPEAFAELLRRCAGLPIAIRILGSRAAMYPNFPLTVFAEQLGDPAAPLDALEGGELIASMRAVCSWSCRALDRRAARVFALLGLAPGEDIGLEAAASLAGLPASQVSAALRDLADLYLVVQHAPGRYRMHDLIRLYATDRAGHDLAEEDRDATVRRLVDWYLHSALAADRQLDPHSAPIELGEPVDGCRPHRPADPTSATAWLAAEHANLLAVQPLAASCGQHTVVWQLAWTLDTFHWRRGLLHDRIGSWRAGLAAAREAADVPAQIMASRLLGDACGLAGQHAEAVRHHHHALDLAHRADDVPSQARVHQALSMAWEHHGDDRRALAHARCALRLLDGIDDAIWQARVLNSVGWYLARLGSDREQAEAHCETALAIFRQHEHWQGQANTLDSLAYLASETGEHGRAVDFYLQALALFRRLGDAYEEADTLVRLGSAHAALAQWDHARTDWGQALQLYRAQRRCDEVERVLRLLEVAEPNGNG